MKVICPHCKETVEMPNETYGKTVSCSLCGKKIDTAKEIAKTFPSLEEILIKPEFIESFKRNIAEANQNISHEDFVDGVRNGTLGIKCLSGNPHQLISGGRRIVFSVLVMLYMFAPLIFAPLWAWYEHNWWLLIGICISFVGTRCAANLIYNQEKQYSVGALFLIASIVCWVWLGIHSCYTFFALCALWGLMLFMMADNAEQEYALQSLIEDSELFTDVIAQNKIMIVQKGKTGIKL
jgi:hypothetical protein